MYMTGTDGVAVSSYAFDDFGRNIDPFTGKVRNGRIQNASKHAYTTNGNIIQPFAFAGYQEDGISGLQFANARYYSADNGRFQSEDNVRGFTDTPFTLNHYGYCWGNPVIYVDLDGNMPYILAGAIVGGLVGAGMEVVSQVTSGEKLNGGKMFSAFVGGAISGAIITANPALVVTSTVAGGAVERTLNGMIRHDSWKDIGIDVGVGAVTDVVFANMGKFIAKTPAVKKITEAVNSTAIGTKLNAIVSKSDRYYRSAMTRARNNGTQVHARTILNGLISQGEKKLESFASKKAFNCYYNSGLDLKDTVKGMFKNGINNLLEKPELCIC